MSTPPIDESALFDLVDHDPDFLESLVETFRRDCTTYLDAIQDAVETKNAEALKQEAHGLKGAAGNMQAEGTRVAARTLEHIGRDEAWDQAPKALQQLEEEVERLLPALDALLDDQ